MSDDSVINVNSMVAVHLSKYEEFPQIGKVCAVADNSITISWFDGAFNDIWSVVRLKGGGEWREKVEKKDILLHDIEITRGQRLKKDTQLYLREYFAENVNVD